MPSTYAARWVIEQCLPRWHDVGQAMARYHRPPPPVQVPECPRYLLEGMCTSALGCWMARDSGQASSPLSAIPTSYLCTSVEEEAHLPGVQASMPSSFGSSQHLGTSCHSCRVTTARPPFPLLHPKRFGPWFSFFFGGHTHTNFRTLPLLGYVEKPAKGPAKFWKQSMDGM